MLAKLGHHRGEPGPAGTANDVADKQDAHGRGSVVVPGAPTRAVPAYRTGRRASASVDRRPVASGDGELPANQAGEVLGAVRIAGRPTFGHSQVDTARRIVDGVQRIAKATKHPRRKPAAE